jgi:hypothetical protein
MCNIQVRLGPNNSYLNILTKPHSGPSRKARADIEVEFLEQDHNNDDDLQIEFR